MVNQYHFLVTNFSSYQSDSLTFVSKAGILPLQTNAFLFLIDQAGKLYKEVPLLNEKPFYISNCVKSSSNSINLLGFRNNISDMQSLSQSGMGELVYLLLNAEGNIYFDNSKLP